MASVDDQIPSSKISKINPGNGIPKVNEDRFIRERLLSDEEFQNLWACSDQGLRRIILAEMNLPLRLEDLKRLRRKNINHRLSEFRGVQAKTGKEYAEVVKSLKSRVAVQNRYKILFMKSGESRRSTRTISTAPRPPDGP
jgi:hypothetical protein